MFSTVLKDVGGILSAPGQTISRLMKEKKWLPVFLFVVLGAALCTNIMLSLGITQMAADSGLAESLPGAQFMDIAAAPGLLERIFITIITLLGYSLSFVVGAFFIYLFFGIGGTEGYYKNYFRAVAAASVIDTLIPALRDTLSLIFEVNLVALTNLSTLFPSLTPPTFRFFLVLQVDLFTLWYLIAIAAGVAVFAKISFKKSLFIAGLYFFFSALVSASFSYIGFKIASSMMTSF